MYGVGITGRVSLGDSVVEYDPGRGRYRRMRSDGEVEVSLEVFGEHSLVAEPVHSLYVPEFITRHILIELADKSLIPPSSSIAFTVKIPVDLGVFVVGDDYYRLIDVIPLGKYYKYTLYGPHATLEEITGLICRHWRSQLHYEKPVTEPGECILEVEAVNEAEEPLFISKILVDASFTPLFYERGTFNCYAGRVRLTVKGRGRGKYRIPGSRFPRAT